MSDEQALLAAIHAHPDEDTPRLAYADWLDEHGTTDAQTARAEFIRTQIEFSRLPDWGDDDEEDCREALAAREKALLAAHKHAWIRPTWPSAQGLRRDGIGFRRGFPEVAQVRTDELREYATDIAAHPLLRHLAVSALDAFTLEDLLNLPWLEEVRGLELIATPSDRFAGPDWSRLGDCRRFPALRSLEFGHAAPLLRGHARWLAANDTLAGVRDLRFWEHPGHDALTPLLSGPAFASPDLLEVYNPTHRNSDRQSFPGVATNPRCAALTRLRLNGFAALAEDVNALAASPAWGTLRELRLRDARLNDRALAALGRAGGRLETLSLRDNRFHTLEGLSGPTLATLRALDLSTNPHLSAEGLAAVADAAPHLRYLDLTANAAMGDRAARAIAAAPGFGHLRQIDFINANVGPGGAVALAESPHLSDRLTLLLHGCTLDDRARAALRGRFGDRAQW